jgi:hypothetical protein
VWVCLSALVENPTFDSQVIILSDLLAVLVQTYKYWHICAPSSLSEQGSSKFDTWVYLFYWYKRTNTDTYAPPRHSQSKEALVTTPAKFLFYLRYWYKRTNTDTCAPPQS